jgi:hypothetical protein
MIPSLAGWAVTSLRRQQLWAARVGFASSLMTAKASTQTVVDGKFGVLQGVAVSGADQDRMIGDHGVVVSESATD